MHLLIDSDPMVYGCGFAVQKKGEDGSIVAEPVSHAYQSLRMLISFMRRDINQKLAQHEQRIISESFYLTGKGNYRERLATIKPYKGNRDPLHKPVHYKALREYLRKEYKAQVVEGYEADDAVSMAQHNSGFEETIICTIDKDLMMVPGLIYNYKKKDLSIVSPLAARRAFYTQLLVGDVTDNIGGCYKTGKKRAAQVMEGLTRTSRETFSKAAYEACLKEYKLSLSRPGCPYSHMQPEEALLENARLLWMQTCPGELWVPPNAKAAWLPGYGPKHGR